DDRRGRYGKSPGDDGLESASGRGRTATRSPSSPEVSQWRPGRGPSGGRRPRPVLFVCCSRRGAGTSQLGAFYPLRILRSVPFRFLAVGGGSASGTSSATRGAASVILGVTRSSTVTHRR